MTDDSNWLNDTKFTVPDPESIRRRRFWIRLYFVIAAVFLALGIFGSFFFN